LLRRSQGCFDLENEPPALHTVRMGWYVPRIVMKWPDIIAPMSEAQFFDDLRAAQLWHLPATPCDRYASLIQWPLIQELLTGRQFPDERIRVTTAGNAVPRPFFTTADGDIDPERILRIVESGGSLILESPHDFVPALGELRDQLLTRTTDRVGTAVVVTTGSGGALKLHFDPEDLLILQVEGTKRWQVFEPTVAHPVSGMRMPLPGTLTEVRTANMCPGESLFVPAGYWHQCQNGPGRSIHVCIYFEPISLPIMVRTLLHRMLDDEQSREPLFRHTSETAFGQDAEGYARLKLIQAIDRWPLRPPARPASQEVSVLQGENE
jgi:hypothetical protein